MKFPMLSLVAHAFYTSVNAKWLRFVYVSRPLNCPKGFSLFNAAVASESTVVVCLQPKGPQFSVWMRTCGCSTCKDCKKTDTIGMAIKSTIAANDGKINQRNDRCVIGVSCVSPRCTEGRRRPSANGVPSLFQKAFFFCGGRVCGFHVRERLLCRFITL